MIPYQSAAGKIPAADLYFLGKIDGERPKKESREKLLADEILLFPLLQERGHAFLLVEG